MLEADVVIGTIDGNNDTLPIMAHPPNNKSDLSLDDFLNQVINYNNESISSNRTKKGIKLDFKTTETFNISVEVIKKNLEKVNQTIFQFSYM